MMGSLENLIQAVGYPGLFFIVFAECGLFFGFFLPGDSLLLTAGLLAAKFPHLFSIWVLLPGLYISAFSGDQTGYLFGAKTGPALFRREESRFFKRSHLLKAQAFYEKYGGVTIILARFIPAVRTFAPIVAGAAKMPYRRFVSFSLIGCLCWAVGVTSLGYYLGRTLGELAHADRYLLGIVLCFFFIPGLPPLYHFLQARKEGRAAAATPSSAAPEPD